MGDVVTVSSTSSSAEHGSPATSLGSTLKSTAQRRALDRHPCNYLGRDVGDGARGGARCAHRRAPAARPRLPLRLHAFCCASRLPPREA